VKEDVKNRTERLKVESRLAERQAYTEHIKAAYSSRIRKRNTTNMMQLVLIAIILGTVIGWLMYGNNVLYYSAGMLALYISFGHAGFSDKPSQCLISFSFFLNPLPIRLPPAK
jgi:hypothetical protein